MYAMAMIFPMQKSNENFKILHLFLLQDIIILPQSHLGECFNCGQSNTQLIIVIPTKLS